MTEKNIQYYYIFYLLALDALHLVPSLYLLVLTCVLGAQKLHIIETYLLSTFNIIMF